MKKKTKVILVKHIHSGLSISSINDKWLYAIIEAKDVDFEIIQGRAINSIKHNFINNSLAEEVVGDKDICIVYLNSDKTFYNRGSRRYNEDYNNTQEFYEIVNMYFNQGFNLTEQPQEQIDYYIRAEEKEREQMKKDGFVLWKSWKERVPEDYKGGFSDAVFNCKELKEYISSKCVFGWIGHSVRKIELDKAIEEGLRLRGLSSSKMYNWISSSDGRHFGDSLSSLSLQEQIKEINKNLNRMFNMCLIYGDENHTGQLSSSNKIREEMKQKGWLLNENEERA